MNNIPDIVYTWAGINNEIDTRNRYNNELYFSIKICTKIFIMV